MLTRTTTRRSAAVLMVALVAMLLVATGGTARATPARLSAGTAPTVAAPHPGRHVVAAVPTSSDQSPLHVDLASTPPATDGAVDRRVVAQVAEQAQPRRTTDGLTPVGRGPPAR